MQGYIYPNEFELQWGLLVVLYPYLTGLVAGAFILASLERVFNVKEVPQVPSIQYWSGARNGTTSERGMESAEPHLRGIWDKNGRLMVVMSHNTDIADGWEKDRENEEYFREFSVKKSFPIGINIVVYALTH